MFLPGAAMLYRFKKWFYELKFSFFKFKKQCYGLEKLSDELHISFHGLICLLFALKNSLYGVENTQSELEKPFYELVFPLFGFN
jgi:hypothetical protein